MNRLWIRFSLVIGIFILILILLPLGTIVVLEEARLVSIIRDSPGDEGIRLQDVPEGLASITAVVSVIGVALGIWLSRGLSAPIVELSNAAKQIGAGNLEERVPILHHSHELDELATSFNSMAADLERSEMVRNNMLADISHELRTPLTVLSGQLRAALDKVYQLDDEELANLYGQTQHLIHLVEDLHLLAQAEARRLPLNKAELDLAELWQELTANFMLLAEEKGVSFTVDIPPDLPSITADSSRLRQLFSNLLANAFRHTPTGGEVAVTASADDQQVSLAIRDSGEGISGEHLAHLFDRFYRVDASRSRDTGGSGLGLAIAKAMVEAHQGTITAVSAGHNQGSTFTIALPLTNPQPAPSTNPTRVQVQDGPNAHQA
ncbi:MAG: ATP-binding protein [Chloroflexota bacterium]